MSVLRQLSLKAQQSCRATVRSAGVFMQDVGHGLLEVSHNTLALVGLIAVALIVFVAGRSELRHTVEMQALGWLQARQEARTDPLELMANDLRKVGTLTPLSGGPGEPDPQSVQVHVKSGWYALALPKTSGNNPVDALDAAVLSEAVLGPVLGISDLRTDPRIRFVPGTHDTSELEQAISSGKADVAFHLRAVTFNEMRTVADSGRCMPPKTTWIEPKLRSGLTIYSLEDH